MKKTIVTAALGFGVVVGSLLGGPSVSAAPMAGAKAAVAMNLTACPCDVMVTTSRLNLRSGPGTGYDVILVMPEGAELQAWNTEDARQDGFVRVRYDDTMGWASEDFLGDRADGSGGEYDTSGDEYEIVDTGTINDRVNFRSGPGTDYAVQDVLGVGEQVAYSDVVLNGFRYVLHAGQNGWVYDEYIDLDGSTSGGGDYEPGSTLTTTSNLNLRKLPNTSSDVLLVMPEGAQVIAHAESENGFVTVTYKGITGWAYLDYLN